MFPWYLKFSRRDLQSFPFYRFPLFLCIDRWGRLSHLCLLFSWTVHSNANIFPFLLCFFLLFVSQLFVRPPQTAVLLFYISFSGDGLDCCLLYNVTNLRPWTPRLLPCPGYCKQAAINVEVHVSLSFLCMPSSGIAGSYSVLFEISIICFWL